MLQIADLSEVAERLERRRADRLATEGKVTLRLGSRATALAGRLVDLSAGGLGCAVPSGTPVKVGDAVQAALELNGTPLTVTATVVRRRELGPEIELGLELTAVGAEVRRRLDAHIGHLFEAS
jgi:methyl-accepting chemotaxis protein